jgi:hypothetical protein
MAANAGSTTDAAIASRRSRWRTLLVRSNHASTTSIVAVAAVAIATRGVPRQASGGHRDQHQQADAEAHPRHALVGALHRRRGGRRAADPRTSGRAAAANAGALGGASDGAAGVSSTGSR